MSSKSAAHISEILGIAPTSSSHLSERPQVKLTSLTDELEIEKITTSTKSVADYFKEKLNTRSFSSTIVSASTPSRDSDDSYDTPRMGLGSRARLENLTAIGQVERETQRMGLSTFPAFSSSLASEKTLEEEGSATIQMNANLHFQARDSKKKEEKKTTAKTKDEAMEKVDTAGEDIDETKEREERKRKRKLDKAKKDPQDDLKTQEKRKRKAEKLQASVTSPYTDTPVDEEKPQKERKEKKKGSKPR
jgi:Pin2-interacting protein X1